MKELKIKNMVKCSVFTALIVLGAYLKIPVPFISFTLQTTFVTLAGLILGAKLGITSVLIYLFAGLIGLPVFTGGGGPGYILKPTFGYIIGFVIAAFITGYIAHKKEKATYKRLLVASFAGLVVIYLCGMVYYYFISRYYLGVDVTVKHVITYCCLVTAPGDIVLTFVAALIAKRISPIINSNS